MTHTILCVEDNPENQTLVRRILESRGYRVVVAGDGLSGVQLAQEIEPDLILMDMNLPGIDGHAATTRIKSIPKLRNIPVVALTANALSGDRERTLAAGCDGYLSKPFKLHELIASVGEFLTGKRERIQPSEKLGYVEQYASRLVVELESQVKALQKANEELRTLDRLKDEFVSTVSHELRTPLNIILGHAEVLEDEIFGELNPQQRRYVSNIVGSAHHLSELVQDILDLSRIESGQFSLRPQWFTLAPVLDELRTLLEPLAQSKGIALGLRGAPSHGAGVRGPPALQTGDPQPDVQRAQVHARRGHRPLLHDLPGTGHPAHRGTRYGHRDRPGASGADLRALSSGRCVGQPRGGGDGPGARPHAGVRAPARR